VGLKKPAEIEQMRPAGQFVAAVLTALQQVAEPGMTTRDLDAYAHRLIGDAGARSVYLGYHPPFGAMPYPGVLCTSVNDAALHGLPSEEVLAPGDVVSVDFAAQLDGWVADSAVTFQLPPTTDDAQRLIATTAAALDAGIAAARVGARMGDISAAIGAVGQDAGYGVNPDFGGHGVGRTMHEEPHVPNLGRRGSGQRLKAGLVIAIEPWFMATTEDYVVDPDGWTIRSADGSITAHCEHTIALTDTGPVVLTART